MSVLLMCAIYDIKVGAYAPPMCFRTKGEAIRSFTDACRDDKLPFKAHRSDYRIMLIGAYEDSTGLVTSVSPEILISADEVEL